MIYKEMSELTNHSVSLSPAQVTKMKKGINVTLSPHHFTEAGEHIIGVLPMTHKRILSALRKGKGLKVSLRPDEGLYKKTTGGILSLKDIGNKIKSGFQDFGHKAEAGLKQVGNVVAKPLVNSLIQGGIPAVTSLAGDVIGGPAGGIAGAVAGQALANVVQKEASKAGYGLKKRGRKPKSMAGDLIHIDLGSHNGVKDGEGLFQTLHKMGISRKKAEGAFKNIGKKALKLGAVAVQGALASYGVNPAISAPIVGTLEHLGETAIDNGKIHLKDVGNATASTVGKIAKEQALGYLDAKMKDLPPQYRDIAEGAIRDLELRDGTDPHMIGAGANVYGSLAYRKAMKRINGGAIRRPMVGGAIGEMTLSPYQGYTSPAMHPFIPHKNELQGYNPIKGGGSIYPAGVRRGGSFMPAGSG